jgi:hypothetical protein
MVWLARQEWALFGSPVLRAADDDGAPALHFADPAAATHELQAPMLSRVLTYWYAVSRLPIVGHSGELRPWSGAFVSWLARSAGLAPAAFPPTVLHWDYIERFMEGGIDNAFITRDPSRYAPRRGDLVCTLRGAAARVEPPRPVPLEQLRRGPYHCDVVVAASADGIDTIGGNVGDTVALTRFAVDPAGLLLPHPRRPWAAVLENRSP